MAKHLNKSDVGNTGEALSYIVDCTLATVDDLALKKSSSKRELERQIGIAQAGIYWMTTFNIQPTGRAQDVVEKFNGYVHRYVDALRAGNQ